MGVDELRWPQRVRRSRLRRLYESEAAGLIDTELLDEVGLALWLRVRAILDLASARNDGRVRCPRCDRAGRETFVTRATRSREEVMKCPECGWSAPWGDYVRRSRRRQLNIGGAGPAFERFAREYPRLRSTRAKMLAVDRLIHEFHYSLRAEPDRPTRAAGVNLICGKLGEVVRFLDGLSAGSVELERARDQWRGKVERTHGLRRE